MIDLTFINIKLENITIKFQKSDFKFIINDDILTVKDILDYIINDIKNELVEKYICIKIDNNINLQTKKDSIIMGNIEILIYIYNGLCEYEEEIPIEKKYIYNNFICIYLNYIFKLLLYLNNMVNNNEIKYKILNNSLIIIYKLLEYTTEIKNNDIRNDLISLKELLIKKRDDNVNHYISGDDE